VSIYNKLNDVLTNPSSTLEQGKAAWHAAVADTVDILVKFGLASVIESAAEGLSAAGLEALAFAPVGTVSEFFAVLATGALVIEAPVIIAAVAVVGVAVLVQSDSFKSWYDSNVKDPVGDWVENKLDTAVGITLDGYISGATVFADANGNGKLDQGEASDTTDVSGNFTVTGGTGPLIAVGGTDISTGLAFRGQLEAPEGSTVIDPLTTLVSGLASMGLTVAAANDKVLAALGLPTGIDLTTLDLVAKAKAGDTTGAEAYVAAAKVIDTAAAIASTFRSAGESYLAAFQDAYAALTSGVGGLTTGQTLNLADQSTLAGIINGAGLSEGVSAAPFLSKLSMSIAASNASLDQSLAQHGAGASLISDVSATQAAIQSPSAIFWQNTSTGQASIWDMDGNTRIGGGAVSANPGPAWRAVERGDFDKDGHPDILWQNASTGQASVWEMAGTTRVGGGAVANSPGLSWTAVGAGDFNNDGFADILWQNTSTGQASIWEMQENTRVGGGAVANIPGPAWKAVGTGDFNEDGFADILWQNTTTGQVSIWEMHGNTRTGGGAVSLNPGPDWHAIGTGDFNADGLSDILFQNRSTGQVSVWEMDGTDKIGGGAVSNNPGTSWHAIGTGAGGSDILFQNTSGQTSIWEMDENVRIGGGAVSPNPGPNWHAIGLT
jgi:hypothetical protein